MTDAEKDVAWRSLPEDFKRQLRCDYTTAESAYSLDPTNVRIEAHKYFLGMYFGKHNLTATEEESKFKVGDRVRLSPSAPLKDRFGFGDLFVEFPSIIKELDGDKALISYFDYELRDVPVEYLIPYTDEQEPKDDDGLAAKIERDAKMASDMTRSMINDEVNWLAYRMELAKEVTPKVISVLSDGGVSSDFCDNVIYKVATIVDGIVERLIGGER